MTIIYADLIIIRRLKAGAGIKKTLIATATAECSLQPLGKEGGQLQEGVFGRTFVAYMPPDTAIAKTDRVTDQNGNEYDVTDVVERDFGAWPFKEVILKKT